MSMLEKICEVVQFESRLTELPSYKMQFTVYSEVFNAKSSLILRIAHCISPK